MLLWHILGWKELKSVCRVSQNITCGAEKVKDLTLSFSSGILAILNF